MQTYIKYLLESAEESFKKTVALVAGSYKPPTMGHLYMVQYYAEQADEVIVLISAPKSAKSVRKTALGTIITPEMSKQIWEIYLKKYGLKNVTVEVSSEASPITAMFKYVDDNLKKVNVIFGVSKKGGDEARFKSATRYYADNPDINLLDPIETAVEPYKSEDGKAVSATDIRDNLDKPDVVKTMLPDKLGPSEIKKVIEILSSGPKESIEEDDEEQEVDKESMEPVDETECIHLNINDDVLKTAIIRAYNTNQTAIDDQGKQIPVNPKKFPDRAIDIMFVVNGIELHIFLDKETKDWDSSFKFRGMPEAKLSPEQMGQFFGTRFYRLLLSKCKKEWPLTDEMYGDLYNGMLEKRMKCPGARELQTEDGEFKDDQVRAAQKKREKLRQKEKDKAAKAKYTNSGRKIVSFSDFGVKTNTFKGYCWPQPGKEFRWSSWADWRKLKPLCRISFKHNDYNYGVSISTYDDNFDNRGFRGYNLDIEPPLAWITPDECAQVMELSLFKKFARHCVARIEKYINMPTEDILAKINNPDKVSAGDIDKTKAIIRKVLNTAIKPCKADTFSWK